MLPYGTAKKSKRNFHKKRMSWIRQYVTVFFSGTASMFLGASLVHNFLQPDLDFTDIFGSEGGMKSNLEGDKGWLFTSSSRGK